MAQTQDLEFQALGWHAEDIEVDEREPSKYIIKIFGKTKDGHSVAATVKNFTPYFYVKVPDNWDKPQKVLFFEKIRDMLPKKLRTSLFPIKSIKKKNFWGFTNKKLFTFIRFACHNLKSMRALVRIFEKPIHIPKLNNKPTLYQLFESNIDPYIRFMHIAEIQPCGWISLPADKYYKTTDILPTISKYDVEIDWQHVKALNIDQTAPFKVASFDIECTSSSGEFPVAQKNYRTVASQLYELFKWHQTNGSNDYKTKEALEAAILYSLQIREDKPNGNVPIFRHNTKEPVSKSLLDEIKAHIDDIATILSGKFKAAADTGATAETKASSRDKIISTLTTRLNKILPPLEGDSIIQIGTTVHLYGEKECSYKSIITLGTCAPIGDAIVIQCQTERELLLKWKDLIKEINPDIITGYNIFGFDFSYMVDRAKELGVYSSFMNLSRICDRECEYKEARLSSSALGDNILKYINMEGRVLIDLMKVVQRDHKLDSYKLDNVAYHFLNMNKNDVSPNEIFELQKGDEHDRKVIAQYCIQDCALCNLLMMKLEIVANNMGMANVCCVPLTFIFMRGQGIKIFSLVLQQCKDEGFLIPVVKVQNNVDNEDEDSYEGAIVLEPKTGIYIDDPISVLDYASLYPSSMISENLSHDMLVLDPQYDNLPGVEYHDVSYDLYDNDKKKIGEKVCRFVQPPNEEKGVIPNILMKLLKARKTTRKRMTLRDAVVKATGEEIQGYLNDDVFEDLDGNKYKVEDLVDLKSTYTEFQKAVLDGLQNAYKVTANSLYGQIGARTSQIYLKDIAACTTATGRKMILMAKKFLEDKYKANVIYGDSVAGYTPVTIRANGKVFIDTVENVANKYGSSLGWIQCVEEGKQDKESVELPNVEIWTDDGWTQAKRLIRHDLASHKKMLRITTHTGVVDVTDDHSLIRDDGSVVKPNELKIGDRLLHWDLPDFCTDDSTITNPDEARIMGFFMGDGSCGTYTTKHGIKSSWALNNADMKLQEIYLGLCKKVYPHLDFEILDTLQSSHVYKLVPKSIEYGSVRKFINQYREMLYDGDAKIVPAAILNGSIEVKEAFWQGLYDADGDKDKNGYTRIDQKNHISSATIFALASSIGYKVSVNTRVDKPKITRTTMTKKTQRKDTDEIKKITEIEYTGYVYDFTTENHKFAAGVGRIIVHNTDSIFVIFPNTQKEAEIEVPHGHPILTPSSGKLKIMPSIENAIDASSKFKKLLKKPHDLEYEKTFWPFILLSKKRYVGNMYEMDNNKFKQKSMGIVLKRRDNANIVKKIYGGIIETILNKQDVQGSIKFLKDQLQMMIDGKCDINDLIITKALRAEYKDPTRIAHKVLAERIGDRDPGNKPQINDRIPYVYVKVDKKDVKEKVLQGERIEPPEYVKKHNLKIDYGHYITNQIMKPILQVYGLVVEQVPGFSKPLRYYDIIEENLVKAMNEDDKKVKEKLMTIKENDVKELLFDPYLSIIENGKKIRKSRVAGKYYTYNEK